MATFSHLPAELVEYIYSYLSQPDLYAVCRLNKGLHALALPFLYRHVDLYISEGDRIPRIDRFCLNISKDHRLAARVESIRLGPSSEGNVKTGQRWLPRDSHFDDDAMYALAMKALENESLVTKGDYLRDALLMREYAAYAALIMMILPNLQRFHISDFDRASLDHLHTALRNLRSELEWNHRQASEGLMVRLSCVSTATFNVDHFSGVSYPPNQTRFNLEPILNLPGLNQLEFSIPDGLDRRVRILGAVSQWNTTYFGTRTKRLDNITRLVIRTSQPAVNLLRPLLADTVQLQSLTYEMFYDCDERDDAPAQWIDLGAWSDSLPRTLRILVFAVENCNSSAFPFKQPRIGDKLYGYLDLTRYTELHTLEVPYPFLTGDADFSITTEIYPLFPPNLRHLSLRTDMSNAQHYFSFDTSRLPRSLTLQESQDEARCLVNARMDVSYMFHAAMTLLDFATGLETISIWQPADPSLTWFDGQIEDFANACRNKSIKSLMVYPMMLRWKNREHWNLVKEVSICEPSGSTPPNYERLLRRERDGIPLGLSSQYHLHALRNHQVRFR
ncbi:hypothetical protein DE146DRAFT_248918 [Phaeosphaeria sp. MPI-PUGE-AT-0046c]|nr:hypothetical protein DE146DRAFT_248918 [Phaeosphaeria sp. MPI-PUGE-AT-0046c]